MTRLAVRVYAGGRPLSVASAVDWDGTPQALADDHAADVRRTHPGAGGDLTVWVWPTRPGEHYLRQAPADAQRYDHPAPLPA